MDVTIIQPRKLRGLLGAAFLFSLSLWQSGAMAQTTVYTAGATPDCNYTNARDAIVAASAQVGGTAEVRLAFATVSSLSYSATNTELAIVNPSANVYIYGGYASCSSTTPTASANTIVRYANPSIDATHSLLTISNTYTSGARQSLRLRQIRMEGAFNRSLGGPTFGGGLSVTGNISAVLTDSTITGFHASNGGGVSVATLSSVATSLYPRVDLVNSEIIENTAVDGGGIYALLGRVRLTESSVSDNVASRNGGGIYIFDNDDAGDYNSSNNRALEIRGQLLSGTVGNSISGNTAGGATYSATSGFGGGIYNRNGHIQIQDQFGGILGSNGQLFTNNSANRGGAIYTQGPTGVAGTPFALIRSTGAYFASNSSRGEGAAIYLLNAVDATISGNGGSCGFGIFALRICSGFFSNQATGTDGIGFLDRGSIFIRNERADEFSRPIFRSYSNMFSGNSDLAGGTAVAAAAGGGSRLLFNRNIFISNSASNAGDSALVSGLNGIDLNFRYNTVLDSNTSVRMFYMSGGVLDVTGSILWGTVDRTMPFHFVWFDTNGATMTHGACLLVRTSDNGTAGIPNPEQLWAGYAPDLDANFAPRGTSPAIDHCDSIGGAPPNDIYGNGVYDVPGMPSRFPSPTPNYDLGAVEQTDVIFAQPFGLRPEN